MTENEAQTHIIQNNEDTRGDLYTAAQQLYEAQEYEKAIKIYTDMLLYDTQSDLYVKMGNCFNKLGKASTAIEYWQKAIDIDSQNSDAFINLGNYYYSKNQFEKAITYWIASLIVMPEEPTSNLNLAIAYTFKELPITALKYYEKYLKYAQNKTSEKYKNIEKQIEKKKKLANDYLKLGVQYQSSGDKKSALKCYKRAIQYYPIFSKIHLNLGSLYYEDNNFEEAIKHWTNALYLDPSYPKILNNLAISYDMIEKFDYAYCYYSQYLSTLTNDKVLYDKIATRCQRLKFQISKNQYIIDQHLEKAKNAFSKCNYVFAINEFKNYIILKPEEQFTYGDMIIKLDNYLNPEQKIIIMCNEKGTQLINKHEYQTAQPYFARILVLAEQGSMEYNSAKRKLAVCLQHS